MLADLTPRFERGCVVLITLYESKCYSLETGMSYFDYGCTWWTQWQLRVCICQSGAIPNVV